jgi:hypothetical protein
MDTQTEEFTDIGNLFKSDLVLKMVLFSMLFYIMNSPVVFHILSKNLRNIIDINLLQTIIFGVLFYLMSLHL